MWERDASSVKSAAITSALIPCFDANSSASTRSFASRRATNVTPRPLAASNAAISAPIPEDAPVTRQVRAGFGAGSAMARA